MAAIWRNDGNGWQLLAREGFPDEAALHRLVEQSPQVLPLAGTPQLVIIGREVQLGSGYADLLAIESTGRLAIIEVKLSRNAEARRAVVAQVLAYAAYLRGMDSVALEQDILGRYLHSFGYETLAQAVAANDQEGSFDAALFAEGLADSLTNGRFRLVFVLDSAPEELVRLVGYLESITHGLVIDLVTMSAYRVDGSDVLVPQRVEPEDRPKEQLTTAPHTKAQGSFVEGADEFAKRIALAPEQHRATLRRLYEWALSLERDKLVRLGTYIAKSGRVTLLPRLQVEGVGLVTLWNDNGAYISFWRSVFERRAPKGLARIEQIIHPKHVGQGNYSHFINEELLAALTDAYREASKAPIEA
jgi:hypothetical protein